MRKTAIPIAAIAALVLAGCGTNGGEEGQTPTETATETETVAPEGQQAEPIETEDLIGEDQFGTDEPAAVRWIAVGETLQIVVVGSGSLDCVPRPIDAWTDGEQVEIEFEPADETATCTMDLRSHVWTVTWDEPLDADGPLPLVLTNVEGPETQFETELPAEPIE